MVEQYEDASGEDRQRSETDEAIIGRVIAGDVEVFENLIIRHQAHVRRIVGGHVRPDMIDEVAHQVFVRAYVSLPTFSFRVPFQHWLATIAVRTCYDTWRRQGAHREVPASAIADSEQQWADAVLAQESAERFQALVRQREAAEVVEVALSRLSPENRMVLTLVHLEGRSVREAASLLGWSVVNVKVRAHRARQQLRKVIEGLVKEAE